MSMTKNDFKVFINKTIHIIWKSFFFIRSSYKTFQEIIIQQYESHGNHYASSPNESLGECDKQEEHWDNDNNVLVFFAIIVIKKKYPNKSNIGEKKTLCLIYCIIQGSERTCWGHHCSRWRTIMAMGDDVGRWEMWWQARAALWPKSSSCDIK